MLRSCNFLSALLFAVFLGACGGGRTAIAGVPDVGSRAMRTLRANRVDSMVAVDAAPSKYRIYVPDLGGDRVTAYSPKGKLTLTITADINGPFAVAVDQAGKIYVANDFPNSFSGNVTTYTPDGKQTTPTITAGIDYPQGILVTKSGKIY